MPRNARRLSAWSNKATSGIKELIQIEQTKFEAGVNLRIKQLERNVPSALPPIVEKEVTEIRETIESVTETYVTEAKE